MHLQRWEWMMSVLKDYRCFHPMPRSLIGRNTVQQKASFVVGSAQPWPSRKACATQGVR